MNPLQTLYSIYWDSTRPMRLVTILLYPLAAFGIYLSHIAADTDADLMLHIAPWWVWALMVGYVFTARVVGLFFWHGIVATRKTTPIVGVIFWSMLLASNLTHPDTLAFGTLYGVAAIIEGWILSRAWLED